MQISPAPASNSRRPKLECLRLLATGRVGLYLMINEVVILSSYPHAQGPRSDPAVGDSNYPTLSPEQ